MPVRKRVGKGALSETLIKILIRRGGIIDECKENKNHLYSYRYGINENWRSSKPLLETYKKIRRNHVPLWFIERHIKFISTRCTWIKLDQSYSYRPKEYVYKNDVAMECLGFDRDTNILISMELPEKRDVMINAELVTLSCLGGERVKPIHKTLEIIATNTTNEIGFWANPMILLWRHISNRYLAIYGLDCKMCNKHKKNKMPICADLSKYSLDICADCLKSACKLSEQIRFQTLNTAISGA